MAVFAICRVKDGVLTVTWRGASIEGVDSMARVKRVRLSEIEADFMVADPTGGSTRAVADKWRASCGVPRRTIGDVECERDVARLLSSIVSKDGCCK